MRIDSSALSSAALDPTLRAAHAQAARQASRPIQAVAQSEPDSVEAGRTAPLGPDGRPGYAWGIQRMIDAGRYIPAAPNSRVGAALAQAGITPPTDSPVDELDDEPPVAPQDPADAAEASVYTTADVQALVGAFNTTAGADAFRTEFDFNADGAIDGADLAHLLANLGQPKPATTDLDADAPYTMSDVEGLKLAWGAVDAGSRAAARYDFNADAVIDGADLATLLTRLGADSGTPRTDGGIVEEPAIDPIEPALTTVAPGAHAAQEHEAAMSLSFDEAIAGVDVSDLSAALAAEPTTLQRADILAQLRAQLSELLSTGSADPARPSLAELLARFARGD